VIGYALNRMVAGRTDCRSPSSDSLRVVGLVGGATKVFLEVQGDSGGWTVQEVELTESVGETLRFGLVFERQALSGQSVVAHVDDVYVQQDCCNVDEECPPTSACELGSCPGKDSFCSYKAVDDCCIVDADCNDGNLCTEDICLDDHTCVNMLICCVVDVDCDDGDSLCTIDLCEDGLCVFTPVNGPGCCTAPIFWDDFSADLGWEYGEEWERAGAVLSACSGSKYADPADDHTSSMDNHIAGVVVGGCANKVKHPMSYLTSPKIPIDQGQSAYLTYWRYLNTSVNPQMMSSVEVFDGESWQVVWEPSGFLVPWDDSEWTYVKHDITGFANPELRVRFGFSVLAVTGVMVTSSWNLDDVMIVGGSPSSPPCCFYDSDCSAFEQDCLAGRCM
jgi:hypothetical protein